MPHIHEKIDFTVESFIIHKDKLLLRMHDKFKIWLSIGGHIELDEDPNQAAIREAKEEVGLDINIIPHQSYHNFEDEDCQELIPPRYMGRHPVNPTHEHIMFVYFATADTDQIVKEKEDDQCVWVTKEELAKMNLRPNVRFYAEKAFEALAS